MTRGLGALTCVVVCLSGPCPSARAGDWPQILGQNRNGIAVEEPIVSRWPAEGPPVSWERPVGSGFAGVAVVGDRVLVFQRERSSELLESLDAGSGTPIWRKSSAETTFYPQVGGGDGPLCVPTVAGDVVVTYGAQGVLTAHRLDTGEILWQRATHKDFGAQEGYFGAGSSPLVAGDTVIVNVGGSRAQSGIVGFDLATGETRWTQSAEQASYSAPVLTEFSGVPAAIVITRLKCIALDPKTGGLFWQFPFGQRGPTVNGAAPLMWDGRMFVTASYGIGAACYDVGLGGFKPLWESDNLLSSQYTTPILHDGVLYGIHGRDDVPPSDLVCIDPIKQTTLWREPSFGYATLIGAGNQVIAVKTDGTIVLFACDRNAYRPLAKSRVFRSTVRALPALANGGLYLRDESTLKRFDVSAR
ncbi:MAG: PQQ-like beta-propeller repeat protein [Planctomyces sp.]|nr:PQQ-like beta-propeller repeat protein [Planctomyces sp.]